MRGKGWAFVAVLAVLVVACGPAVAGPEWLEGGGDAGRTPMDAQPTTGEGPLTKINGQLEGLIDGGFVGPKVPDLEDVYIICIEDGASFSASTILGDGFAEFESRLFLFELQGNGLLGNIDPDTGGPEAVGGFNGATLENFSTDGTGVQIELSGLYLLGITVEARTPQSASGDIFLFEDPTEVSGPDGPGGLGPLDDWFDEDVDPVGACLVDYYKYYQCIMVTEAACKSLGGEYLGDGSSCPSQLTRGDGRRRAGPVFDGEYSIVLTGTCFATAVPTGACIFTSGSCVVSTEFVCAQNGGDYAGDDTECPIVEPTGADRVSGSEKGSLLVFSKVELRWDDQGNLIQDTFLDLANDWPDDVQVQFYFLNGDPPLNEPGVRLHPGWNWVDVGTTLTKNQPAYFSLLTGQPGPDGASVPSFTELDPSPDPLTQGRPATDGTTDRVLRGMVYAWAVDGQNREISWNHLKGDVTIVNYEDMTAWEYNAWAFQDAQGLEPGTLLNQPYGQLDLDGVEYVPGFAQLQLDFYAAGSMALSGGTGPYVSEITLDTDLTLHPVQADFRQEGDGPVTTKANFVIWNEDETQLTGLHRCITCWDQTLLSQYATLVNHFLLANLQTDKGRARIDGLASSVECGISQNASLLGVAAKRLNYNDGDSHAAGGTNLIGMGTEPRVGAIRYDPVGGGGGPPS